MTCQRLYFPLEDFRGSYALLADAPRPTRAVVFVHGFGGSASRSWRHFGEVVADPEWDRATDYYFYEYDSVHTEITANAELLNTFIDAAFPEAGCLATSSSVHTTPFAARTYSELILAGHSLGGVILRAAMLERLKQHHVRGQPMLQLEKPLRLFAPALAGARPAGLAGLLMSTRGLGSTAKAILAASSPYSELQPGSPLLTMLASQTEHFAETYPSCNAARAEILWAESDRVVVSIGYRCDLTAGRPRGTRHTTVCRPSGGYLSPLEFIEATA